MRFKSIELSDFRNYKDLSLNFHPKTNILYGDNAQGKTNILEALYLCCTTRSHKASKDKEMIRIGKEEAHLRIGIEKEGIDHTIDMHLKKNRSKGIAIDGVPIKKSSELIGLVQVVFFSPEDLGIIKDGPGERRRFIDMELCQLDKVYLYDLARYNRIVGQRNNLLKQIGFNKDLLDTLSIWDLQLEDYGKKIIKRRKEFVFQLNKIVYEIHKRISGGKEELFLEYEPNVTEDDFEKKLRGAMERDISQRTSTVGPHRDDIKFLIQDTDIRKFGSQGQQRTCALSLKLAEIEILRKEKKTEPILLLDDVLSELDRSRQNYLLDHIENIQTIITCTGLEEFINRRLAMNRVYKVINGTVFREQEEI